MAAKRLAPARAKTAPAVAGYSGKPLAAKLGIKAGQHVLLIDAPPALVPALKRPDFASFASVKSASAVPGKTKAPLDYVHLFVRERAVLAKALPAIRSRLASNGMIWVSWPKQAAKIETDVSENVVRDVALPAGLVDIKVCAVDETWSGLKLVIPVKDRPERKP
ncbi:MAG TPA: DUF3052 family protein [Candidatus Cybelea sp.]|nr:DUF3052 family protein [Candidatus Cybelea sp.]